MAFTSTTLILISCLSPILCITNDKTIRDSYLSAYMDSQGTNDSPVGVVYPEPSRPYGPPQPKPMYGPPSIPSGGHVMEIAGPTFSIMDILSQLPEKLEFLPKAASVLLTVTKILLKVVVLKIILKFVFIFCLYFFLPKLEMLDMMTSMTGMEMSEPTTVKTPLNATTTAAAPETEDQEEEMRLNKMADFVMDSIEARKFLDKFCNSDESHYKCKILKNILKVDNTMSIQKLFSSIWIPHRDKYSTREKESTKVNYLR
ncbi:uncharacterized protein LOC135846225 [Planococcus citri]|uniref:uncharacterized protein LOC135846225 n=1 Tax=Planococcus citri TaxID=170843 RepID=UPI0031F7CE3B